MLFKFFIIAIFVAFVYSQMELVDKMKEFATMIQNATSFIDKMPTIPPFEYEYGEEEEATEDYYNIFG